MKHLILALAAGLVVDYLYAQGFTAPSGSFSQMVGSCSVTEKNIWSAINNPAGLTLSQKPEFGLFSEQRFRLSELKSAALAFSYPLKNLHAGLSYQYYGLTEFNEQRLNLSVARLLNRSVRLGVCLAYQNLQVSEYGNTGTFILGTGIRISLSDQTACGIYLYNLSLAHYAHQPQTPLPVYARIGLSHQMAKSVTLLGEWEQGFSAVQQTRMGLRYTPQPYLMLAIGYHSAPDTYSFGTGLRYKNLLLQFACSVHLQLELTPAIDLIYAIP